MQSAGELENDEHTAGVIMQMVRTANRFRLPGAAEVPFKRMSGKSHLTGEPRYRRPALTRFCPQWFWRTSFWR